jgi:hypothetical protein
LPANCSGRRLSKALLWRIWRIAAACADKKSTFDLDDLNASIRNRVNVETDRLKLAPPVGCVRPSFQAGTLWFNDEAFAQSLFQKAWVNRQHAVLPVQMRDEKLLSRFCKIQE